MENLEIKDGSILVMKKPHPCGSCEWTVLRTGQDIKMRCNGCGHEVMTGRRNIVKKIKSVK